MSRKYQVFAVIMAVVLILDYWTKRWALETLPGNPGELFGGLVPLTLAYNRGAAFGIEIGDDPRYVFIPITVVALILLTALLRQAAANDWLRIVSVSLVMAGALGNLWDRLRWDRGVVDFLGPIDLGFMDWPIFNVADMAITCGAVMLAVSFWLEEEPGTAPLEAPGTAAPADVPEAEAGEGDAVAPPVAEGSTPPPPPDRG